MQAFKERSVRRCDPQKQRSNILYMSTWKSPVALYKALVEAKVSTDTATEAAQSVVDDIRTVINNLATRQELTQEILAARKDLRHEILLTKRELQNEIHATKNELQSEIRETKSEIQATKIELQSEIHATKSEIQTTKIDLRAEIKVLETKMDSKFKIMQVYMVIIGILAASSSPIFAPLVKVIEHLL